MSGIEGYLSELKRELRLRWTPSARFLEETRGHLADAIAAGEKQGLLREQAEQEALARFGSPRLVAGRFAAERYRRLEWIMLAPAVLVGLSIAWIDSRPHWDDSGITAGMLVIGSGLLGLAMTRRAWMIALAVGVWIPLDLIFHAAKFGSAAASLLILLFPLAGAYAGMGVRRLVQGPGR
ncbi:MAG: permease prefix domain 1-containing protein [Acidobacteriaceae bacterium]